MSNWYGSARTNAVEVIDIAGLKASLENIDIQIIERENNQVIFLPPNDGDGDFNYSYDDDEGDLHEFIWEYYVMPYIKENEVLIVMSCGAEKLRYITGDALAFNRVGDKVDAVALNLNDIYDMAKEKFKVDTVKPAEY